jgi:uncharacterized membrane protein
MLYQPFFVPASIILFLAVPLILGMIPPNRIYGVRTTATLADKRRWYDANRYGGWTLLGSSLFYLAIAALWPNTIAGTSDLGRWILHLGGFAGSLLVSLLLIHKYVQRF